MGKVLTDVRMKYPPGGWYLRKKGWFPDIIHLDDTCPNITRSDIVYPPTYPQPTSPDIYTPGNRFDCRYYVAYFSLSKRKQQRVCFPIITFYFELILQQTSFEFVQSAFVLIVWQSSLFVITILFYTFYCLYAPLKMQFEWCKDIHHTFYFRQTYKMHAEKAYVW